MKLGEKFFRRVISFLIVILLLAITFICIFGATFTQSQDASKCTDEYTGITLEDALDYQDELDTNY